MPAHPVLFSTVLQGQPASDPSLASIQGEVVCPLGRPGSRRWVYAVRGLVECFSRDAEQCPNALKVGGGVCCRAHLHAVPPVGSPGPVLETESGLPAAEATGRRSHSHRRGPWSRVKHRIRRLRNRAADVIFVVVVVPALIATILFGFEGCRLSLTPRGGGSERERVEFSR